MRINVYIPDGDYAYTTLALITRTLAELADKLQHPIQIVHENPDSVDKLTGFSIKRVTDSLIADSDYCRSD